MSKLLGFIDDDWRPVSVLGVGDEDGSIIYVEVANQPSSSQTLQEGPTLTHGSNFSPLIGLSAPATIIWRDSLTNADLATGSTPTFNSSGSVTMFVTDLAAVEYLNCGFDHGQDTGIYDIGPSFNYETQSLLGIDDLNSLTNLKYFMCNNTAFNDSIDFSGLSSLEHIECFTANVTSVNLTGCSSLIRLCLEQSAIDYLDLNPVASTLRDLRSALQSGTTGRLEFASIIGQMPLLYHYCVRDQPVVNHIPLSKMPSVVQRWDWNTAFGGVLTNFEPPTSFNVVLSDYFTYQNPYTSEQLDSILTGLLSVPFSGNAHLILVGTGSVPGSVGMAALGTLVNDIGWEIDEDWP